MAEQWYTNEWIDSNGNVKRTHSRIQNLGNGRARVFTMDSPPRERLNEALIHNLTGGDHIESRVLNQSPD